MPSKQMNGSIASLIYPVLYGQRLFSEPMRAGGDSLVGQKSLKPLDIGEILESSDHGRSIPRVGRAI